MCPSPIEGGVGPWGRQGQGAGRQGVWLFGLSSFSCDQISLRQSAPTSVASHAHCRPGRRHPPIPQRHCGTVHTPLAYHVTPNTYTYHPPIVTCVYRRPQPQPRHSGLHHTVKGAWG